MADAPKDTYSYDPEMDMVNWQLGFDEGYKHGLEDAAKRSADTIDSFLASYEITGNRTNLIRQLNDYVAAIRAKIRERDDDN